ncbi:MgtC/SapB family protein [Lichenicola sp.]|uniref:MgtC/SapB family protein n=1 Tax=Lichenicola sp. TaxID=2804529 RepID=UPI003AFF994D
MAFVLSALIGLEREVRQKSAGLRTYTSVGVASALFMLISKYGFTDVIVPNRVVLDPSRIAAQVVSGIGFIGGGVIFMRRDIVRGLTTAASIWFTAALGMACGAGLPLLAIGTTLAHFTIMLGFPRLVRRLKRNRRSASEIRIAYADGRGLLRTILIRCTELRFAIDHVRLDRQDRLDTSARDSGDLAEHELEALDHLGGAGPGAVTLRMQVKGKRPISHLIAALGDIDGVLEVGTTDDEAALD